jgi:O-antigen/teichoic acid export membrane protein
MEKPTRDSTFLAIVHYASSNIFLKSFAFFTALVRTKLLSPELFGLWTILNILPTYASYLDLGSRSALRFRVPLYKARNRPKAVRNAEAAVYHGTLYPSVLLAAGLLMGALWIDAQPELKGGLVFVAVLVLLNWRYDFLIAVAKAHERFRLIGLSYFVYATVTFVLTLALIAGFGFYGALAASVIGVIVAIVFIERRFGRQRPRPGQFRPHMFFALVKPGFPIVALNLSTDLLRTVDRFILWFVLGGEVVGHYGIAIIASGIALSIPSTSREIVEPRLVTRLEQGTLEDTVAMFLVQPLLNTAFLMPVLIGVIFLLLPPFINAFLPQYAPGIDPARILVLGGYFLALAYALRGMIVAFDAQVGAAWLALAVLGLNIAISLALLHLGWGAEGVAFASGLSFLILFALLLHYVARLIATRGVLRLTRQLLPAALPFPLLYAVLFWPAEGIGLPSHAAGAELLLKIAVFVGVQAVLLSVALRKGFVSRGMFRS